MSSDVERSFGKVFGVEGGKVIVVHTFDSVSKALEHAWELSLQVNMMHCSFRLKCDGKCDVFYIFEPRA